MAELEMQKFCLTWKDFNSVFNREFNELRESGDFFDVTLACEDGQISAHKLVLSAASDFFKEILRKNNHEHPLIYLNGIRAADVSSIMDFIYTGETEVAENNLEILLSTGGNLRVKGLTESQEQDIGATEPGRKSGRKNVPKPWEPHPVIKAEGTENEENYPLVSDDYEHQSDYEHALGQSSPINVSRFLSTNNSPRQSGKQMWPPLGPFPRKLGHQRALVKSNNLNESELNRQVSELMVSSYDPVLGKTIWQCAQCHYSSKLRYTVKEHVETHISGFCHQCPLCQKTCKTRNALRVHTIRKHSTKGMQQAGGGGGGGNTQTCNTPRMGHEPQTGTQMELGNQEQRALEPPKKEKKQQQKPIQQELPKPTKDTLRQDDQLRQPDTHMGHLNQGIMNHPMMGHPMMGGGFMGHPMMGHPMMGHPSMSHPSNHPTMSQTDHILRKM